MSTSLLKSGDFYGFLSLDTDITLVDLWLDENEEFVFRMHFDAGFSDLVYSTTPPPKVQEFIGGFFPLFRRVLFFEYQKQKNALTAGTLAGETAPSVGGVGLNFKAHILKIGNDGATTCNKYVSEFDFGALNVKFIPFQTSTIFGI